MPPEPGRAWRRLALSIALLLATGCHTTLPLEPGDVDLAVTAEALAEFGLPLPDDYREHERLERQRVTGGVLMIEYELSAPDAPFLVYSLAELHRSPSDACRSFAAGNFGLLLSGLEVRERNDLFRHGERSRFAIVETDGRPVGNLFSMCRSRTALLVMFVGIYFDDLEPWRKLIEPRLLALESLEASQP